jgi:hypothetical protein
MFEVNEENALRVQDFPPLLLKAGPDCVVV